MRSPLADAATLLLPADPAVPGAVFLAPDGRPPRDVDVVVWVLPVATRADVPRALRREAHLLRQRAPGALRPQRRHRLGPSELRPGALRAAARRALLGGAVVELSRIGPYERTLDVAARDAGDDRRPARLSIGSGGTVLAPITVDGADAILRAGIRGTDGDPVRSSVVLGELAALAIPEVPRALGTGASGGASWTAESRLHGRRPHDLAPTLVADVRALLERLPSSDGPPTSLADDGRAISAALPRHAEAVERVLTTAAAVVADLPAVLRHGDLWSGNLLASDGRLTGVVDWDAWHDSAVPGTDLVQLLVTDERHRRSLSLGEVFGERPWRGGSIGAELRAHLAARGVDAGERALDAVATAWWATEVAGTLGRAPHLAEDRAWLAANVEPVLA